MALMPMDRKGWYYDASNLLRSRDVRGVARRGAILPCGHPGRGKQAG
jgi:hypothetical protein